MKPTNLAVYGILDNVTNEFIGNLILMRHDAAAIRLYGDAAEAQNSQIAKRPHDYDLVKLGYLTEDNHIIDNYQVVLTGTQWAASQRPQLTKEA